MARPLNFGALSRDDLVVALRDLVARGVVSANDIRLMVERARRISSLEAELERLRGGTAARPARRFRGARTPTAGRNASAAPKPPKRRITNTPKRQAALRRQGQYLVALKRLSGRDHARVKAVAKESGVQAAIELAGRLLAK